MWRFKRLLRGWLVRPGQCVSGGAHFGYFENGYVVGEAGINCRWRTWNLWHRDGTGSRWDRSFHSSKTISNQLCYSDKWQHIKYFFRYSTSLLFTDSSLRIGFIKHWIIFKNMTKSHNNKNWEDNLAQKNNQKILEGKNFRGRTYNPNARQNVQFCFGQSNSEIC